MHDQTCSSERKYVFGSDVSFIYYDIPRQVKHRVNIIYSFLQEIAHEIFQFPTIPNYYTFPSTVAVSQPCHDIVLPGETELHGYIGHESEFLNIGGNKCETCPHDEIYKGGTNKDENNQYVCQYRPAGDMTAGEVLSLDAETLLTYNWGNMFVVLKSYNINFLLIKANTIGTYYF